MDAWPTLTKAEARAILMPYWEEIRDVFVGSGMPEPADIRELVIDSKWHDSCRHFAATRMDGKVLYVAPQLADMPIETIRGILAHEAGHVVDLRNPGLYWWRKGKLCLVEEIPSKGRRKVLNMWEDRDDDEVERVADGIAHLATGLRIGYIGSPSCLVQALGKGRKRPEGLR